MPPFQFFIWESYHTCRKETRHFVPPGGIGYGEVLHMDEMQTNNRVILCGTPLSAPVFSHASRLEMFYTFPLEVARLSGTVDTINVLLREELLPELKPSRAGLIRVGGEVRSFNNHSGEGSRLVISVFARELSLPETNVWINEVELTGTL